MLGADLIGFQTHSFARHFRQTVSRILGVEATPKGIQLSSGQNLRPENNSLSSNDTNENLNGLEKSNLEKVNDLKKDSTSEHTFVDVAVFPMGIDVQNLTRKRKEREVDEWVRALKERYKGMKMIVARDKLDEVQVGKVNTQTSLREIELLFDRVYGKSSWHMNDSWNKMKIFRARFVYYLS